MLEKLLRIEEDECAFLLVLLNSDDAYKIESTFKNSDLDLEKLTEKVRKKCWDFHYDKHGGMV